MNFHWNRLSVDSNRILLNVELACLDNVANVKTLGDRALVTMGSYYESIDQVFVFTIFDLPVSTLATNLGSVNPNSNTFKNLARTRNEIVYRFQQTNYP